MKKLLSFLVVILISITAFAQSVTLTFTAKDAANQHVQLHRVSITNLTKGWQETIYWPDTTLTMQNGTGISDIVGANDYSPLRLSQNNPNPFTGTTEVNLMVATEGTVALDIADINGRIVVVNDYTLQPGPHQFRITLATAGTYVMTARQSGQTSSIKMVCNGGIDANKMEYTGVVMLNDYLPKSAKFNPRGATNNPFTFGDQMEYVGYAIINGSEAESQRIMQAQGASQTFTLQFTETQIQVQLPTVTTNIVSDITEMSATCGGTVTSDGGALVTARGVCWSTSQNPTLNDSHTTNGSGTGSFTSSITGLTAGTTYYVRAYATNSAGTAYGNGVSFTTVVTANDGGIPCPGMSTVTDVDNNTYNTVQIGNQCWMKENMRTTHYSDGTSIIFGNGTSTTTAYRYYPNGNSSNVLSYGYLYNWKAVIGDSSSSSANPSDIQGICPSGWHVPSDAEWTQLTDYMSSQSQYVCGSYNIYIAKALASTTEWISSSTTCAIGENPSSNNATGFSALPAGFSDGYCFNFGGGAYFWSATKSLATHVYCYVLKFNNAYVDRVSDGTSRGFSVRCVRNEGDSTCLPTVGTHVVTSIATISAFCGGTVTSDGGASVTARGVCWSTSQNPTVSDSHTTNGSGTGSFTSNLTGLTAGTTYYVRAYATNSVGTAYGNEFSFTTTLDGQPCSGVSTVTDIDNNTYNTVTIGAQCWMKENLRTTSYANGAGIALGNSTSTTTAYRYYPNNDQSNVSTYGYLYNWKAVMGFSSSSSANPSGVQGICPTGWHVPSDAEWTQLTDYVSSQSQYVCGDDNTYIAKALASITGWNSSTYFCGVGNNPSSNNSTGFSALPAGDGYGSYFDYFGDTAYFWSATGSGSAYYRNIYCGNAVVLRNFISKYFGFSVRCVRD
jgi:uncharacterized protein (TIGR02145 family)